MFRLTVTAPVVAFTATFEIGMAPIPLLNFINISSANTDEAESNPMRTTKADANKLFFMTHLHFVFEPVIRPIDNQIATGDSSRYPAIGVNPPFGGFFDAPLGFDGSYKRLKLNPAGRRFLCESLVAAPFSIRFSFHFGVKFCPAIHLGEKPICLCPRFL